MTRLGQWLWSVLRWFAPFRWRRVQALPPAGQAIAVSEAGSVEDVAVLEPPMAGLVPIPVTFPATVRGNAATAATEPGPMEPASVPARLLASGARIQGTPLEQWESSAIREPEPVELIPVPEWRRGYFRPGQYAAAGQTSGRILAPDLAFQLRPKRHAAEPRPLIEEPEAVVVEARVAAVEPLCAVATATQARGESEAGMVAALDPILFSAYLWDRENGPVVPKTAMVEYLRRADLLERALGLRDAVLARWLQGGAPLSAAALREMAAARTKHEGSGLLLCHNVTKSFARGGAAIPWRVADRQRGIYTDGARSYQNSTTRGGRCASSRSMFYALFSESDFGGEDPGDWCRYFGVAAMAAFTLQGATAAPAAAEGKAAELARRLDRLAVRMLAECDAPAAADRAVAWTNAFVFLETGLYARARKRLEQVAAQAAAAYGLAASLCGGAPARAGRWLVPSGGEPPGNVETADLSAWGWTALDTRGAAVFDT